MLKKAAEEYAIKRDLSPVQRQLETFKQSVFSTATTTERLLGIEGAAARAYFSCFNEFLDPKWNFEGRKRRPSPDPINALLSLTYTLVHYEFVKQLMGKGLDPYLGFFHKPFYGRESLACDGIELLRPEIDYWVIKLINSGTFNIGHFKQENRSIVLANNARGIYFNEFNSQSKKWRKRVRAYVELFCGYIESYGSKKEGDQS
jgi:CRISPR-associated protein Cas1